jgi:hypothetical protein
MFRSRAISIAVLAVAALFLCYAMAKFAVAHADLVRPTAETRSAFLDSYSPDDVFKRFDLHLGSQSAYGSAAAPGKGFTTHRRTLDYSLVIRAQDAPALPKALADQATQLLQSNKLNVLGQSRTNRDGYVIHYGSGPTDGTITIDPVKPDAKAQEQLRTSADKLPITEHIVVQEKWTRPQK